MNDDKCHGSGSTLVPFLAGAFVGATVALLFAPRSGKETREIISEFGTDIKDRISEFPDDLQDFAGPGIKQGKEMIEKGKEMISKGTDLINQGKHYIDDKKKALNAAIEAGKEAMQQEKETLAATMEDDGE